MSINIGDNNNINKSNIGNKINNSACENTTQNFKDIPNGSIVCGGEIKASSISSEGNVMAGKSIKTKNIKTGKNVFYKKDGFWIGVLSGVIGSLITSGVILGINELVKLF